MSIKEKLGIDKVDSFVEAEDLKNIHKTKLEFTDRLVTIAIAGMGLIAVFAWDEALKHLFKVLFPEEGTLWGDISYAVILTLLATGASVYLRKMVIKKHKEYDKEK